MKRLDQALVTLCFIPSYFWYARRICGGGEDLLSALLLLLCLGVTYFQKQGREWKVGAPVITGMALYISLWLLGAPAMVKAAVAITTLLYTTGALRHFGASALAYLSLPWLSSFQYFFGYPLRRIVAETASVLLNAMGLAVEAQGTGLSFHGASVFVDPPCSGVRMIWAILVLTSLLSVITRSSWRSGILLCLSAVTLAVAGNVLRAVVLFFPESQLVHWPAWTHQTVGILAYGLICSAVFFIFHLITNDQKTLTRYVITH